MGVSEQPLLSKTVLEGPCLVRMLKLRREAYFINWCQFLLQTPFLSTEAQVCRWEHWIHVQNEAAVKRTWSRVLGLDVGTPDLRSIQKQTSPVWKPKKKLLQCCSWSEPRNLLPTNLDQCQAAPAWEIQIQLLTASSLFKENGFVSDYHTTF